VTSFAVVEPGGGGGRRAGGTRKPRLSKARCPDRRRRLWDQLWESRDDAPYDLSFADNGALIVGTGNKGKIYRLDGDPVRPTLLARAGAQQITGFYKDGRGRLYYATANPGKLFRLSSERAARGTYESEPRDAQMVSTWGSVSWHGVASGGNQIEVFTRSGNTETPDETWSPWSAAYKTSDGSAITSPKARYLQWRAVLTGSGEGPVLTSITAAYLQRNLRPQVRSITIHPPGIVFQKPFATGEPDLAGFDDQTTPDRRLSSAALSGQQGTTNSPALGRRTYQKGLQTLVWKADDENDDDLLYDVLYRREGETGWRVLRRALEEPILVWDDDSPNGTTHQGRRIGSTVERDRDSLAGELDGAALEIDNTHPASRSEREVRRRRTTIVFDARRSLTDSTC
jgi:hypothetical protein